MQSFTFGTTPEPVIREAFDRECPDGTIIVIARGIDAVSLEAAGYSEGNWTADDVVRIVGALTDVEDAAAATLAGRYTADEIISNAESLRTSILAALGIEEI
jgi:hypothetical protein